MTELFCFIELSWSWLSFVITLKLNVDLQIVLQVAFETWVKPLSLTILTVFNLSQSI